MHILSEVTHEWSEANTGVGFRFAEETRAMGKTVKHYVNAYNAHAGVGFSEPVRNREHYTYRPRPSPMAFGENWIVHFHR